MASKTGKLILTGAATAALAAGCQTQPLSSSPSLGMGMTPSVSSEYDVLAKKDKGAAPQAKKDCIQATTCDEARYTVFARSQSDVLHFTGSRNVITGDVHTNDGIHMAGNADHITGDAEAVDAISIKGNNNSVGQKVASSVEPYPFQLDPASLGAPTFDFVGDVNLNDRPEVWQSKGVLKDGLYRSTGTISLPTKNAKGTVTFVAKGVQMPGKNHDLKPFVNGVLVYASGTGNNVVHLSGNSNSFAGLILVPNGAFQMTGNSNLLNGQVYTDAFKISGANNRITYSQYIECPPVASTVPSAEPSAEPSIAPTPEAVPSVVESTLPGGEPTESPEVPGTPAPSTSPTGEPIPTPSASDVAGPTPSPSASIPPQPTPTPANTPRPR